MRKLLSAILVVALVLSVTAMAFAEEPNLKVVNATEGKDYHWYRIFTATTEVVGGDTYVTYYTNEAHKTVIDNMNDNANDDYDENCPFEVGTTASASGYVVTVKEGKSDDAIINWLNSNYSKLALADGAMTYAAGVASATVDNGYYYITTTTGSAVTVGSVLGTAVVYDKNPAPGELGKKITAEDETTFDPGLEENDAAVGSVEQFTVSFEAVNFVIKADGSIEKVLNWVIQDTPTYLDIDVSTVKVYVNDTEISGTAFFATKDETTGKLTVNIPWIVTTSENYGDHLYAPASGKITIPVVITYDATVLPGAADAPAPNAVVVSYGHVPEGTAPGNTPNPNNPNDPENPVDPSHPWQPTNPDDPWQPTDPDDPWDPTDPTDPVPVTPLNPDDDGDGNPDPEETVTYTYGFDLIKVDGDGAPLLGAVFTLTKSGDDTPIKFIKTVVDGHYVFRVATQAEIDADPATEGLVSEIALTDYNTAYIRGLDNAEYVLTETHAPTNYNEADPITIKVAAASDPATGEVLTKIETAETDPADLTVVNNFGTELPTTGGIGTTLFYVLGTILVIGSGVVLIARRKASER